MRKARQEAAKKALEFMEKEEIIGLGTGSTVEILIEEMKEKINDFINKLYVPSSISTAVKLAEHGFKVADALSFKDLDIYVDSADEVDREMNMIKGGGAALVREKILTYFSKKRLFIVDYTKMVNRLGEKHLLPIEVFPNYVNMIVQELNKRGYEAKIRISRSGKFGPVISDSGGALLDLKIPSNKEIKKVEEELKTIPGIIETGLFIGLADILIVGEERGVKIYQKARN